MSFRVVITRQAEIDLCGIYEYIAYELHAPQSANGQLTRLEEAIFDLDEMPRRYKSYDKEPWRSRGLRVMPVENYLVYYIPDYDSMLVTIIRVMYGGRDTDVQLTNHTSY